MDIQHVVQEFDECEYMSNSIFEDLDGRKFFTAVRVHNKIVTVGDLVRVVLEGDDDDEESYAYCQVLAIYDEKDEENGDGVKFEARWFTSVDDLDAKQQKLVQYEYEDDNDNDEDKDYAREKKKEKELIETDVFDDIPIGSVSDHIQIVQMPVASRNSSSGAGGNSNKRRKGSKSTSTTTTDVSSAAESNSTTTTLDTQIVVDGISSFYCRYLQQQGTTALQHIQRHSLFARGIAMSHYSFAYVDYIASLPDTDPRVISTRKGKSGIGTGTGNQRITNSNETETMYSNAIRKLHVSVLPEKLPCRSKERDYIHGAIKDAIVNRQDCAKPLYISGMPGTGKTATVLATINELRQETKNGNLDDFDFIEINCLRLQAPAQAYSVLWRGLSGVHASSAKALKLLEEHFLNASINNNNNNNNSNGNGNNKKKQRKVTVCLVDELDYLMTRSEEVVYNFFNWPMRTNSLFAVIGIANVMDLPERLTSRVASRIALSMDRMIFRAYEHAQIKEILEERLGELQLTFLTKASLELISRKAATVAGDLRAALKICQRTIELHRDCEEKYHRLKIEYEKKNIEYLEKQAKFVNDQSVQSYSNSMDVAALDESTAPQAPPPPRTLMNLVSTAAAEYKESPMMATVSRLCTLDKAILIAICKHHRATDETEISSQGLWDRLTDLIQALSRPRAETANGNGNAVATDAPLFQPPVFIYDEALDRLLEQGLLTQVGKGRGVGSLDGTLRGPFSLRLEFTDVMVALKGDHMLNFV